MELSPGTSICGRFELLREESPNTGVPVFGPTWVVLDSQRGEPARACVLDASLLPTAEARAAFVRAQQALSEVRDAALVPQVFVGEDGDYVVVCYEPLADAFALGDLYEGPGAADLLQDCGRIARQLARALASLHARGQVHGMLACEAVFVAPGGPATFQHGFAPLCARAELERRCKAFHIAAIAPEVLAGGPFTPASDVYAWAAAMLQMVTGQRGEGALRAPEPAGLPAGLWSVLHDCLSEGPSTRPQTGAELVARLEALAAAPASEEPAVPLPPPPPDPRDSPSATPPPVPQASSPEPAEPPRPRPPTVPLPVTSLEDLLLASDHPRPTPPPEVVATPSSTTGAHQTLDGEGRTAGRSATGLRKVHVLTEDAIVRPGKPPRAPGDPPGEPSDVIIGGTKAELEEASRATTVRLDPDNANEAVKAAREAARRSALIPVPREEPPAASATVAPAAVSTISGEPVSAASSSNPSPAEPAQSTVAAPTGKKSDASFWWLVAALLVALIVAWSFG